jgi:hypothetical protein
MLSKSDITSCAASHRQSWWRPTGGGGARWLLIAYKAPAARSRLGCGAVMVVQRLSTLATAAFEYTSGAVSSSENPA